MNGGVLRISFTGDVRPRRMIPNRWLSVPRPRRPCSSTQRREFVVLISLRLGLKGYAAESTPPHPRCRRDKGRSTEAEGDGDVRRFLLSEFQHRRLDKTFSIDGLPMGWAGACPKIKRVQGRASAQRGIFRQGAPANHDAGSGAGPMPKEGHVCASTPASTDSTVASISMPGVCPTWLSRSL